MSPNRNGEHPAVVDVDRKVQLPMGVCVAIAVAIFSLGGTLTWFSMRVDLLSERVERLTLVIERHVNSSITSNHIPPDLWPCKDVSP
jgi:hypothetical protein